MKIEISLFIFMSIIKCFNLQAQERKQHLPLLLSKKLIFLFPFIIECFVFFLFFDFDFFSRLWSMFCVLFKCNSMCEIFISTFLLEWLFASITTISVNVKVTHATYWIHNSDEVSNEISSVPNAQQWRCHYYVLQRTSNVFVTVIMSG